MCINALGGVRLDPARPHLNALDSRGRLDWADFKEDFIISQSAEVTEVPPKEVIARLGKQHEKTKLGVQTLFGKTPPYPSAFKFEEFSLPELALTGKQLQGLLECQIKKCSFKLEQESEIAPLVESKNRAKTLNELIRKRLKDYLAEKKLKGYESRTDNIPFIKKALRLSGFLKSRYPKTYSYLETEFWKNSKTTDSPLQSYIRAEVIQMAGEKAQPVFRLSENLEFNERGYLNVEIPIYTNHFFDSSLRIFEVFDWPPDPQKAVYVVTDLIEVDELKKSRLIRNLFKTPMEEAVAEFRKSEMKELR